MNMRYPLCLVALACLLTILTFTACDEDTVTVETMTDFVPYFIEEDSTKTPCLDSLYELGSVSEAHIYYNSGLDVIVNDDDLCVTITNDVDGDVPDTIVVGHCDGTVCDTTIIVVFSCSRCNTPQHECTPYPETSTDKSFVEEWLNPSDSKTFGLGSPSGPGGGIVSVNMMAQPPTVPWLAVDDDFVNGGAISSGSSATTSSPSVRKTSFVCYPGAAFFARVNPFFPEGAFPQNFTLTYSVEEKADCYEPNDNILQAKMIPKDELLEAYALPGHVSWALGTGSPQNYDWYRFTVDSMAYIRFELNTMPSDIRLDATFFDTNQLAMGSQYIPLQGMQYHLGSTYRRETGPVPPGTYYIALEALGYTSVINDDTPAPQHWSMKYKFKVTTF